MAATKRWRRQTQDFRSSRSLDTLLQSKRDAASDL
jgi:hypothetical protein